MGTNHLSQIETNPALKGRQPARDGWNPSILNQYPIQALKGRPTFSDGWSPSPLMTNITLFCDLLHKAKRAIRTTFRKLEVMHQRIQIFGDCLNSINARLWQIGGMERSENTLKDTYCSLLFLVQGYFRIALIFVIQVTDKHWFCDELEWYC